MKNSIFSRLIAVFLSIIIFSFSVTGVMLYFFLDNFVYEEKERVLNQNCQELVTFMTENFEYLNQISYINVFRNVLKVYKENTNSYVWVVDTEGNIVMTHKEMPELSIESEILAHMNIKGPGRVSFSDERQYKKVMSGRETIIEKGDFYGLFKDTGDPWLVIAKPFIYRGKVQGAIYFSAAMPKIKEARMSVFKPFLLAVSIAIILSVFLIYIFSKKITNPLKQMNEVAKIIARGDFKQRVQIKSQDEIGELATSFNQMVVALENLEDMRRGFIANVSHELRTPMTSVKGFIEGILDGTIPPERHNYYLNIVREETGRLSRMVNNLLDLAKLEAGEVTISLRDFNINELIRRCIIKLESIIVEKEIQIEANFQREEFYVNADSDAIERVVLNLVHNAVKFTPNGGKITINTVRQRGKIYVSVTDTGIGIDKEELDRIWERFYKSDKSRGRDKTGTGLGLAIIKTIINEHKQDIRVESEVGKGSKFIFSLAPSYAEHDED